MSLQISPVAAKDDPLAPASATFPLGLGLNVRPEVDEAWRSSAARSFGLRQLRTVPPENTAPVLRADYCPRRQVAVVNGVLLTESPMLATQVNSTYTTREDNQSWTDNQSDRD